jgi:NADH-quinone oxidoreductase subunit L
MVNAFWLIPAPPLFGALAMLLVGRKLPRHAVSVLCCATVLVSFLMAADTFFHVFAGAISGGATSGEAVLGDWLPSIQAQWGFHWDGLSGILTLVITGIGSLIHLYSVGYMKTEGGYYRFFGMLNFFVFAMLLLVLANNYVLLFAGWEGVGLASYLLIGFWYRTWNAASAGMQAFIVNRVGDAGLMLGIFLVWMSFGSVRFADMRGGQTGVAYNIIALLLVLGAIGKSAQFPLHIWLPVAMAGPTPVSALIHAATMVTAGVYLIARSHVVFENAPDASMIVAGLGAFTAIFAATVATAKTDIKRVLAWSTISQLGFMFLALGVGAYWAAIFHLVTHAFFKALLFLGAGNVIHALDGEQNLLQMGGLKKSMPQTHLLMLIGTISASGLPGFAGFFSKEEILARVYGSGHNTVLLYSVGLLTALLTSFYMWRLMYLAFYGTPRSERSPHEAPAMMTLPLYVLAFGAVFAGVIGVGVVISGVPIVAGMFLPKASDGAPELLLMAFSTAVAVAGLALGSRLYLRQWRGMIGVALAERFYVDHILHAVFVRGFALGGGRLFSKLDSKVIDGAVNGTGLMVRWAGTVSRWWDRWIVDGLVRITGWTVKISSYPMRLTQTGSVQLYALVFLGGLVAVVGFVVYSAQ